MPNVPATSAPQPLSLRSGMMTRKALLLCGILSSLLYVATCVIAPFLWWEDYDSAAQTVSELVAIGAPTSAIVGPLFTAYSVLVCAFGLGVWASAHRNLALRTVGAGLFVKETLSLAFSPPMHMREAIAAGGGTSSDTMHIVIVSVGLVVMLLVMGVGSSAFGKRFRRYSIVTIVLFIVGGAMTFMEAPRLEANQPTPWMGVWERVCIFAHMLWVAILSILLLCDTDTGSAAGNRRQR
jgi:hypothetical protein